MNDDERTAIGEIDLATLREGFAALACEAGEEPGTCPEPETLYDAVRGRLAPGALRDVVDHVAACPECAEDWRLAMAFEREAGDLPAAEPAPERVAAPPRLRLVPLAATLVLALVAVGVWLTLGTSGPEAPVLRDGGLGGIVSLLPEDRPLERSDPVLRWRLATGAAPAGTSYDLLVGTADLRTVVEVNGLDASEYTLPPEELERLAPGTVLQWRVTAHLPGGESVESPPFRTPLE